jgi:transaldolase/glucose-6-phosphate isomerase
LSRILNDEIHHERQIWTEQGRVERLWQKDARLWTHSGEENWLGWLTATRADLTPFLAFQKWVRQRGFRHLLLMGMGGSSLAPDVFARLLKRPDDLQFHLIDSTNPQQIQAVQSQLDMTSTLFVVASKSGTTLETELLREYFFAQASRALGGAAAAAQQFVAITDPGTALQTLAERDGYAHVFLGDPQIGGRYSALSPYGLGPLAALGVDVTAFIQTAHNMVEACQRPVEQNPGVQLGLTLGCALRQGRDKLTFLNSTQLNCFGHWLQQLLAESLGKQGLGVIPVVGEELAMPERYGSDRIFVNLTIDLLNSDAFEQAGHPVIRLAISDPQQLGAEMFRWQIATAVAGSLIGVNPFDQPDVEASKGVTRRLISHVRSEGQLPAETLRVSDDHLQLFASDRIWNQIRSTHLSEALRAFLRSLHIPDYFAVLAYLEMNAAHEQHLQSLCDLLIKRRGVATQLAFGPRYLHSTGQAYKGGPNQGVFLLLTAETEPDLAVSGTRFGLVQMAQARGDEDVLAQRERRIIRIHLKGHFEKALSALLELVAGASL